MRDICGALIVVGFDHLESVSVVLRQWEQRAIDIHSNFDAQAKALIYNYHTAQGYTLKGRQGMRVPVAAKRNVYLTRVEEFIRFTHRNAMHCWFELEFIESLDDWTYVLTTFIDSNTFESNTVRKLAIHRYLKWVIDNRQGMFIVAYNLLI